MMPTIRDESFGNRVVRLLFGVLTLVIAQGVLSPSIGSARVFDFVENDQVDFDFSTLRGLRLRLADPKIALRLGGRLHTDGVFAEDDRTHIQKFKGDLRRARIYLKGQIYDDFSFKVDRELAPNRKGWRNVSAAYRIGRGVSVKGGNFVAPFGMENIAASNFSTFMERSVSSALSPSFQTGILLRAKGSLGSNKSHHRWTASAAWTTEPLGQSSDDKHRTRHQGFVSRLTYAPIAEQRRVVHFGAAVEYRNIRNRRRYRISSRPESSLAPTLLSTGGLANVESSISVGAEGVGILGPLTIQAEYMRTFLQGSRGRKNLSFQGGYAQVSYLLTGEHRRYSRSSAVVGGVKPNSKWGAVEIGVRFSNLDLNGANVNGGSTQNWTVGLNWYLRENVRFMFNYVAVDAHLRRTHQSDSPHIGQFRFQLFF